MNNHIIDIARQTNMPALNASTEVKKLAEETQVLVGNNKSE
jgi:methyl-accepting chemotaxis protein